MEMLHASDHTARMLERENRELREELRKRVEQQSIMEQIVGNVSSLLDGSSEALCIFDKDGFFLHMNNACRRVIGLLDNQHSSRMSIFEAYVPRDRDRVVREVFSKPTSKWSGMVSFYNKHTGLENTVMQTIEALSSKHSTETAFFKSCFSVQENIQEKIRTYSDMIAHMPHGVGIWRLERGHTTPAVLRLACANKVASQYVGVPLLPGSLIHEVIPNGPGGEVQRFLEDVVRTQRVISLDQFRIGPHSFSVTAYPLYPDFVVVVMDPPKGNGASPVSPPPASTPSPVNKEKDNEFSAFVAASGLGVAACEGPNVIHSNDNLSSMLGLPQAYLKGRDFLTVLETRARSSSRSSIEQIRRAIRERVVHHAEVEFERFACRMSVHPMGEGVRHTLVLSHRTRTLAPQVHSQGPMFPILPSSFSSSPSSSSSFSESKLFSETSVYKDTIDFIPCGIVILKIEDTESVRAQFRVISLNNAAQNLSVAKSLVPGHKFDDATSPFDPAFMRAMRVAAQAHEGRVCVAAEKQSARIVPLNDPAHIAIMFEDSNLFEFPASVFESRSHANVKRSIADLVDVVDRGFAILPSSQPSKYLRNSKQEKDNELVLPFSNKSASLPILPPLQPPQSYSSPSQYTPPSPSTSNSPATSLSIIRIDKMERLVQHCVTGIVCIDVNGGITMANKSFGQMAGYSESDLASAISLSDRTTPSHSLQLVDMVHQDDVGQARAVIRQITTGETTTIDLPLRFIHKQTRSVVWTVASFMAIDKGVVMQVQQPTKLKSFPEVLFADRDVLRSAFREMVVGTAVLDIEGQPRIVSANSGFCAIMAAAESELSGQALTASLHDDDCESVLAVARDVIAARSQRSQLLSVRSNPRSGPSRYGALSLSAVLDSKSNPCLLIAQLQLVDKPFS